MWLFRIARNALANERRRDRRHPQAQLDAALEMAAPDDTEAVVVARDEADRAWRAIERLPEERRRALVLRFVDEMSAREIGAVLGRSEGSVRVLIHRALRAVARDLSESPSDQ
jgi:RNA polymerase sigma-70 factor (ECF subfamily)